jgi:hypothetical protein
MDNLLCMVQVVVLVGVEPVVPVAVVVLTITISRAQFHHQEVEMEKLLPNSLVLECH